MCLVIIQCFEVELEVISVANSGDSRQGLLDP